MLSRIKLCVGALLLSACTEVDTPKSVSPNIIETSFILEAQQAGVKKFDTELSFISMYENNEAVCGDVIKGQGEPQQFIYVRKHFLLQEVSPSGEWEAQWFTECDDG